ncbi:hypothetical protein [Methylobacterium sp. Leaf85]|uniref:hypothetical protein n=1 Tax=Methylobacterium sp. Leaf85 TaxID=1736241 RepID=UPI000701C99B|nr:hypothetical protein [Methylobacterium sp. Leaf85]KQO43032.1 hypothetical protein ASF08_10675 [Methylobacterium sp. Leaf85]
MPPRFSGTPVDEPVQANAPVGPRFGGTLIEDVPSLVGPGIASDVVKTIPSGLARGAMSLVGLPADAMNLIDRGWQHATGYLLEKTGALTPAQVAKLKEPVPGLDGPNETRMRGLFPSSDLMKEGTDAALRKGGLPELYKPQTMPGELANTLMEFAPNAALGGGSAAQRIGQVVAPAVVSEGLGQGSRKLLPEAEPVARFTGALLGGVGAAVAQAPRGGSVLMKEAMSGLSPEDLAAAQALRAEARGLPNGGIDLPLDEALNKVTDGRAGRLSQLSRVVANSGGEGGNTLTNLYAQRPAQMDAAARGTFNMFGPLAPSPSALGLDVQSAARRGLDQTPEGIALAKAREAAGPRMTADMAGQVIQPALRATADLREAVRQGHAARDYRLAREVPENVGIERTIQVERPGDPIITQPAYARPQFEADAPRPAESFERATAGAAEPGAESLARFIAKNGGIRLDGDAAATDLQRFMVPGVGKVARSDGKGIDNFWRERLIEEGYFRPDADGGMARDISSELLRKLQNEQRGFPSYPLDSAGRSKGRAAGGQAADEYANARSLAESRLDEDLTRVEVDPKSLHPDIRERVVGALMRGEETDPLAAYERTVNAMKGPLDPYVKSTTITEEIPDVRFGQVNPEPALAAIDDQARFAKGDVRGALGAARKDLFEPGGAQTDMSVEGLLKARERLDYQIQQASAVGDGTKVRDLTISRTALDTQLKQVPEVAAADARFAANSKPLEPFTGNTPLGRVVQQDPLTKRMAYPSEQVPGLVQGPSATREMLANVTPQARQANEQFWVSKLLDGATDARGNVNADRLNELLRDNSDIVRQMPGVYQKLEGIVRARDGLARLDKTPLGRLAQTDDTKAAQRALFDREALAGSEGEVAAGMGAIARNDPTTAQQLARQYLEGTFNSATRDLKGGPAQYGGAGFASAVRGQAQQEKNLDAALRALPAGDVKTSAVDRLLTALEATGYKPQKGSDTAFNQVITKALANGDGPLSSAITEAVALGAAGGAAGGVGGAVGGTFLGMKRAAGEELLKRRVQRNSSDIARALTDKNVSIEELRAMLQGGSAPGAQMLLTRLLALGSAGSQTGERPRLPVLAR